MSSFRRLFTRRLTATTICASPPRRSSRPRHSSASPAPTSFQPSPPARPLLNRSLPRLPTGSVGGVIVQGSAAWQLDFWGRYRRASESARAQLLATEWGRRAIVTTLVSEVADAYSGSELSISSSMCRGAPSARGRSRSGSPLSGSGAGQPRCSTCVRQSSSSTRPLARLPPSSGRLSSRRISSACCSERYPPV